MENITLSITAARQRRNTANVDVKCIFKYATTSQLPTTCRSGFIFYSGASAVCLTEFRVTDVVISTVIIAYIESLRATNDVSSDYYLKRKGAQGN